MNQISNRIAYFDALNVLSCISVIALHCNGYVHQFDHNDTNWWLHVLIEVLFYTAVPIFFMLSGATVLDYSKRYTTKTFYNKRFKRTVIPYIAFGVFFEIIQVIEHPERVTPLDTCRDFITGSIPYASFWFFIPLFMLYLFTPFLSTMMKNLSERQQLALLVVLFALNTIDQLLDFLDVSLWFPLSSYVIYFLGGYYLSRTSHERNNRLMLILLVLSVLSFAARYAILYNSFERNSLAFGYTTAYTIIPTTAIFLAFKRFANAPNPAILWLSKRSFGVFLLQAFVIQIFMQFIPSQNTLILACIPAVYIICIAITAALQRPKLTRWVVGG